MFCLHTFTHIISFLPSRSKVELKVLHNRKSSAAIKSGLTKKRPGAPESARDNKIAPRSARGAKIGAREIIYVSLIEIC